jgi:Arc/MetJ family transcription regulator
MRTNIDIDDELLTEAMAASGLSTKKATVEEALRRLVQRYRRRAAFADMTGLRWGGTAIWPRCGKGGRPVRTGDRDRQLRLDWAFAEFGQLAGAAVARYRRRGG